MPRALAVDRTKARWPVLTLSGVLFWVEWLIRLVMLPIVIRRKSQPAVCLAWLTIIFLVPLVGLVAYLLIGEVRPGGTAHPAPRPRGGRRRPGPSPRAAAPHRPAGDREVATGHPARRRTRTSAGCCGSIRPSVSGNRRSSTCPPRETAAVRTSGGRNSPSCSAHSCKPAKCEARLLNAGEPGPPACSRSRSEIRGRTSKDRSGVGDFQAMVDRRRPRIDSLTRRPAAVP